MARELPKHRDAFYRYFTHLENGCNHTQAINKAADESGITERTMFRWYKKFNWEDKTIRKQAEIAREMERKSTKDFAENRLKYLNIYHRLLDMFVKQDFPAEIETIKDLDLVTKNCLVLQEQPTEIQKTTNTNIEINSLFDDDLLNEIIEEDNEEQEESKQKK
jgi:hypothetical protein